jgi:subtilisin family serine protease
MNYILVLLISLTLVAAQTERFIIVYDEPAWSTLRLSRVSPSVVHTLDELKMQVADLAEHEIYELENTPGVRIFMDGEVSIFDQASTASGVQENPPSWGIDRIDQRALPLDKLYHYNSGASDVDVWIVDTGILVDHSEFGGRAVFEKNFAGDSKDFDCQGHGTHVSSTIGGATVGVAKEAKLHGVKVLNCQGSGSFSGVLAGINYVVVQHKLVTGRKSVLSMSLGGPKNVPLNLAVEAATLAGVVVTVASGNNAGDACQTSPASAPSAITVNAADKTDANAYFSNFGQCTTLYAPGVDILGASISGKDQFKLLSGTSMATPHVAGAVALILSSGAASTPAAVKEYLIKTATKDTLTKVPAKTANLYLYTWN